MIARQEAAAAANRSGGKLATPGNATPRRSIHGRVLAEAGAPGSPRGMRLPDQHPSVEISDVGWVDRRDQPEEGNGTDSSSTPVVGRQSEINRAAALEQVAHNAALREAAEEEHRHKLAAEFAAAEAERKRKEAEEIAAIEEEERKKRT